MIRSDKDNSCPFSLLIDTACKCVGGAINLMTPTLNIDNKETKEQITKKNQTTYLIYKEDAQCIYADGILEKVNKVNCNYGDNAAGQVSPSYLPASPAYPRIISPGPGMDTLVNNTDPRNFQLAMEKGIDVPFGLYSVFANKTNENNFIKIAEKYTNNLSIRDKVSELRKKYYDTVVALNGNKSIKKLNETELEQLFNIIKTW